MLYLRIAIGTEKERILSLTDDQFPLSIGRDNKNKLPIDNSAVSRYHAVITSHNGNFYLEDLNSTNGTFLNGRQILKDRINPGDAIRIANVGIAVEAEPTTLNEAASPLELAVSIEEEKPPKKVDLTETLAIEDIGPEKLEEQQTKSRVALQVLYKADAVLRDIEDIKLLLENFMDLIMEVIPASRGYIFLLNRDTGMPVPYVRRSLELAEEDTEIVVSKTILKTAVQRKESILSNDALVDERFIHSRSVASLKVRSAMCVPIISRDKVLGLIYLDSTIQSFLFSQEDLSLLSAMAIKAGVTIENARLYDDLRTLFYNTVETLIRALQARDPYTSGHSTRVSRYCLLISEKLGISTKDKHSLYLAAMLHDIGKIGIPDALLQRRGKLSKDEMDIIREHPALGASMIRMLGEMHPIVPLILHHHEAYDGTGYPDGIKGDEIPIISRIIAIADTYDAMTSDRPYRERRKKSEAIKELKRCSGTKLDPKIVDVFLEVLDEISSMQSREPVEMLTRD
ncbi:MAG: FHA domain-containing protein [Candidatus Latescibacteria bacterium]|nr:FHA domain-containing protein [Candidatus Latescibacterota bacterium]NIM66290.1 FHA domain-containing protein [Candidatus Latescibacterota bacterium]NIO02771.1 FHA domain-containing protein [Candidatus Latescibacterota bacterium]NIO29906.1 FHA domain-containing protein [Candidatus Latescibacterota bacterium]NIO57520.1 FHA domain-containing protein [Candidatus Latescibacterota bacterium]